MSFLWIFLLLLSVVRANEPSFEVSNNMRIVLVPADIPVGKIIYRLRGFDADFDYPLTFEIIGATGKSLISLENLPCTKSDSLCQADVKLIKNLEAGRLYDFQIKVRDTNGGETTVPSTIKATNGTATDADVFTKLSSLMLVPEDTKRGTVIDYITARKNPKNVRPVFFELRGAPIFDVQQKLERGNQTRGSIVLNGTLDFERKNIYLLKMYALYCYTNPEFDTRNVAVLDISIIVTDVQDRAPIFTQAPTFTKITSDTEPGDFILEVTAEDGDRGDPRPIRYGLVSDKNPFVSFFNMDPLSGNLTLSKPLKGLVAISRPYQPIILTVVAEEVTSSLKRDLQTSTTDIALMIDDIGSSPPEFANAEYVTRINEGSSLGTALKFQEPYLPKVQDEDQGDRAVFSLSLEGENANIFEVSPSVADRSTTFEIRVKSSESLDYETLPILRFKIVAKEVFEGSVLSSTADVTVYLNDVNDNSPKFTKTEYDVEIYENATAGIPVTTVTATDADANEFGTVRYSMVSSPMSDSLWVDQNTGVVTVASANHGFDRETTPEHWFLVEARDGAGRGENSATATIHIKLLDVNDSPPTFQLPLYEGVMSQDLTRLRSRLIVKAEDADADPPNNDVRYEIIRGNYGKKFTIDTYTGEITVIGLLTGALTSDNLRTNRQSDPPEPLGDLIILHIRAYDLGVPHLYSEVPVQIYVTETTSRTMKFTIPYSPQWVRSNQDKVQDMLSELTGGQAVLRTVDPHIGDLENEITAKRSDVTATVRFRANSVVDMERIKDRLIDNRSEDLKQASIYQADDRTLLWILISLTIILFIIIIIILLCCLCPWGYCYKETRHLRKSRIGSTTGILPSRIKFFHDDIDRDRERMVEVVRVEKSPDRSVGRREAWSADPRRRYWRFPSAGQQRRSAEPARLEMPVSPTAEKVRGHPQEPTVLHTRQLHGHRDGQEVILVEDVDNASGRRKERDRSRERDTSNERQRNKEYVSGDVVMVRRPAHQRLLLRDGHLGIAADEEDRDSDSLLRHEVERGSELGFSRRDTLSLRDREVVSIRESRNRERDDRSPGHQSMYQVASQLTPSRQRREAVDVVTLDESTGRKQRYIRDGNIEILRLDTGGQEARDDDGDAGKEILLRRFMQDQSVNRALGPAGVRLAPTEPSVDIRVIQATPQRAESPSPKPADHHATQENVRDHSPGDTSRRRRRMKRRSPRRSPDKSCPSSETDSDKEESKKRTLSPVRQPIERTSPNRRGIQSPIWEEDPDDAEEEAASARAKYSSVRRRENFQKTESSETPQEFYSEDMDMTSYSDTKASILRRRSHHLTHQLSREDDGTKPLENPRIAAIRREEQDLLQDRLDRSSENEDERKRSSEKHHKRSDRLRDSEEDIYRKASSHRRNSSEIESEKYVSRDDRKRHKRVHRKRSISEPKDGSRASVEDSERRRSRSHSIRHGHRSKSRDKDESRHSSRRSSRDDDAVGSSRRESKDSIPESVSSKEQVRVQWHDQSGTKHSSNEGKEDQKTDKSSEHPSNTTVEKKTETSEPLVSIPEKETVTTPVNPEQQKEISEKTDQTTEKNREYSNSAKERSESVSPRYMDWYDVVRSAHGPRTRPTISQQPAGGDEDLDSGIALSQQGTIARGKKMNPIMEKKSIFTIAYDDMQTKQLRPDTVTPPF